MVSFPARDSRPSTYRYKRHGGWLRFHPPFGLPFRKSPSYRDVFSIITPLPLGSPPQFALIAARAPVLRPRPGLPPLIPMAFVLFEWAAKTRPNYSAVALRKAADTVRLTSSRSRQVADADPIPCSRSGYQRRSLPCHRSGRAPVASRAKAPAQHTFASHRCSFHPHLSSVAATAAPHRATTPHERQ